MADDKEAWLAMFEQMGEPAVQIKLTVWADPIYSVAVEWLAAQSLNRSEESLRLSRESFSLARAANLEAQRASQRAQIANVIGIAGISASIFMWLFPRH